MTNIEINESDENDNLNSKEKLNLLKEEVSKSIAKEFDISHKTAQELLKLKNETLKNWINWLKSELDLNNKIDKRDKNKILSLTSEKLANLYNALSWAKKITNNEFINELEIVKIWVKSSLTKKLFPKLYEKAINPESKADQVMWFCLWWLDSCSTTIKFLFDLGAWVTMTPKHTYLIISWKWEYKKLDKNTFILAFIVSLIVFVYIIYSVLI